MTEASEAAGGTKIARPGPRRPFVRRRKVCPFPRDNSPNVYYKECKVIQRSLARRGKMVWNA